MYEEASQIENDAVSSIRTVASFSAEEKVMDLYKKKCEGPLRAGIRTQIQMKLALGFPSSCCLEFMQPASTLVHGR